MCLVQRIFSFITRVTANCNMRDLSASTSIDPVLNDDEESGTTVVVEN